VKTITLPEREPRPNEPALTLSGLLQVLGKPALDSRWRISDVEATGSSSDALHAASDDGIELDGARLLALADGLHQVIDGDFRAFAEGAEEPWVIVRAVDSTSWDVASTSDEALDAVRMRYAGVIETGGIDW
jgi:hypothetical protein